MSEAKSPFSPNIPKWQTAWDSTSLGWYKTCARLYEYQMLEGWSPRSRGIHLAFGGFYASGLEHYAHYRARGLSHDDATLAMVRYVLEASGERTEDGTFLPWSPGDHKDASIKNRYTLIRSLVWNVEERQTSQFSTVILADGRPAVELTFNFDAFTIEGETISLSGHLDEVVESSTGDTFVRDDKTTKGALGAHYFQQYSPNNQMSLYTIAGGIILSRPVRGVLVKAAQIGAGFTRFQTAQVPRPQAVLTEWMAETKLWIEDARRKALDNFWPRNDRSCGSYGGCSFQKVCSVSPPHRQAWLENDFVKREWNPLIPRGEGV